MEFLDLFTFDGYIAVFVGGWKMRHCSFKKVGTPFDVPTNTDVYFSPAMRSKEGNEKTDVLGTQVLWVDYDDVNKPQPTLPPSAVVFSGHGWHLYWRLKQPCYDRELIEVMNKALATDLDADDCWNVNRILRIPGTKNLKDPENPIDVMLKQFTPAISYDPEDIFTLDKLDKKVRHKIRTGDTRGYKGDRSDRDWAIITALVRANATDELIKTLYDNQPCGDKAKENQNYLPHTILRARESKQEAKAERAQNGGRGGGEVVDGPDGMYVESKSSSRRISTFTLDPTMLLDGSTFGSQDAVVCNVQSDNYVWEDVTFTRAAFTSLSRFDREAPVLAWQFLGSDRDVRAVLPFLLEKLKDIGLPRVSATEMLGLHKIKGRWLFLGDQQTLSDDDLWLGHQGPVCWLPNQKEHPTLDLLPDVSPEELAIIRGLVPALNEPEVVWPMIGWYAATCLKPWLEEHKYRFPIMNVTGTKGSGKTTLIQRVFMPLFGQTDAKTFDSGTTRFVTLALMGSANAVPLAFSEFRYELVERFIRFILLSYDTGHDPRGRGDQTTVDYPLSAPFTVDGEDLIADPAAQERMVVAQLHPHAVEEGTEAYKAYRELRNSLPPHFGGFYIQEVLKRVSDGRALTLLGNASDEVHVHYQKKMPDRVRNNHVVTYFGMKLWCDIVGSELPTPEVLRRSISSVYDIEAGRARTLADHMVEDIVNAITQGYLAFNHVYDGLENVLWFQLAPAHSWWITSRRRQGRGALERDAIRMQLKEAPYSVTPQVLRDALMYGIDLQKAYDSGLDIPLRIPNETYVERRV